MTPPQPPPRDAPIFARIEDLVRRSPPVTVSLAVHAIALLAFAMWFVRRPADTRLALDVSFRSADVVEADSQGSTIETEPVPPPKQLTSDGHAGEESTVSPSATKKPTPARDAMAAQVAPPAVGTLLDGRDAAHRQTLLDEFGGSSATEAAVTAALEWLAKQQDPKDGLWSLLTPSPNLEPGLVRESSCLDSGWKGFSDEEATQCRADRGLAQAG